MGNVNTTFAARGHQQTLDFIRTTTCRNIAEIGVNEGGVSLEFARFLNGEGELHLYDDHDRVAKVHKRLLKAGYTNIFGYSTSPLLTDTHCWSLGRVIQQNSALIGRLYTPGQIAVPQPIYDYIVIDRARCQACDAPTALLADRLLKVGGYLDFVDCDQTLADFLVSPRRSVLVKMILNLIGQRDRRYREIAHNKIFHKIGALPKENKIAIEIPTSHTRSEPIVSCLTVTRGRVGSLRRAVACFHRQTVSAAELIVLYESDDTATAEYVESIQDSAVRGIRVKAGMKLGALRNLAVTNARAPFIAQWDDDDWYAPERLEVQLEAIAKSGRVGCLLSRWTVYDALSRNAYVSNTRPWEGSLVVRREAHTPCDEGLARREDMRPVQSLLDRDQLALLDRPDLYVYVYHGGNTFDLKHFAAIFAASQNLSKTQAALISEKLARDDVAL
jgi:hypothetical protein